MTEFIDKLTKIMALRQQQLRMYAWCATGPGGGIDNSCSPTAPGGYDKEKVADISRKIRRQIDRGTGKPYPEKPPPRKQIETADLEKEKQFYPKPGRLRIAVQFPDGTVTVARPGTKAGGGEFSHPDILDRLIPDRQDYYVPPDYELGWVDSKGRFLDREWVYKATGINDTYGFHPEIAMPKNPRKPYSYPDHEGRPGLVGGSLPRGEGSAGDAGAGEKSQPKKGRIVYHGTNDNNLKSILKKGIVEDTQGINRAHDSLLPPAGVWVTKDPVEAADYATSVFLDEAGKEMPHGAPVIFRARLGPGHFSPQGPSQNIDKVHPREITSYAIIKSNLGGPETWEWHDTKGKRLSWSQVKKSYESQDVFYVPVFIPLEDKEYSYPDHPGRPGQVGGSLAREGESSRPAGTLPSSRAVKRALGEAQLGSSFDESKYKVEARPIDSIKSTEIDQMTPRDELVEKYRKGWPIDPPVINQYGEILDGHHRLASAKAAGYSRIFVVEVTERKAKKNDLSDPPNIVHVNINDGLSYRAALMGVDFTDIEEKRRKFQWYLESHGVDTNTARNEVMGLNHSWDFAAYAFCPTGPGGGIDDSCSPTGEPGKQDKKLPERSSNSDPGYEKFKHLPHGTVVAKSKKGTVEVHIEGNNPGRLRYLARNRSGTNMGTAKSFDSAKDLIENPGQPGVLGGVAQRPWRQEMALDWKEYPFTKTKKNELIGKEFMSLLDTWKGVIDLKPGSPHMKLFEKYSEVRGYSYPDHPGRPGLVGGSLPRGEGQDTAAHGNTVARGERGWAIDAKTGELLVESGTGRPVKEDWQANVELPWKQLEGHELIVAHTHPDESSFSDNDWLNLVLHSNVKSLQVILPSGRVDTISKPDSYDWQRATPRKIREKWQEIEDDIFNSGRSLKMTVGQIVDEINQRLSKETGIIFTSSTPLHKTVKNLLKFSFPDHSGRPGLVGGSLPREDGGTPVSKLPRDEKLALQKHLVDYKASRQLEGPGTSRIGELVPGAHYVGYLDVPGIDVMHEKMGSHPSLQTSLDDYTAARNKLFKARPVEQVPVDNLIFTQPRVNVKELGEMGEVQMNLPVQIIKSGNTYYLMNGHHRVLASITRGRKSIAANVLDVGHHEQPLLKAAEQQYYEWQTQIYHYPGGQPHDQLTHGNWATGEGGGEISPKVVAETAFELNRVPSDIVHENIGKMKIVAQKVMDDMGVTQKYDALREMIGKMPQTAEIYTKNGEWTPDRRAEHQRIINEIVGSVSASPGQPTFVIMGGLPGAGKSEMVKRRSDLNNFVWIDADAIAERLPGYKGWNRPQFQNEVDVITAAIARQALLQRKNVLADGTLKTAEKFVEYINNAKTMGYRTGLLFMETEPETAMRNAITRGTFGDKPRLTDPLYIAEHDGLNKASYYRLRHMVDFNEHWFNKNNNPRQIHD